MFKKILVPVDGSVGSMAALDVAVELATPGKAELVILYVVKPGFGAWAVAPDLQIQNEILESDKKIGDHVLGVAKTKAEKAAGKVELISQIGQPAEVIVEVAQKEKCDCIVIGSRGLSGLEATFLGSVSSGVVQTATIPVVVVK